MKQLQECRPRTVGWPGKSESSLRTSLVLSHLLRRRKDDRENHHFGLLNTIARRLSRENYTKRSAGFPWRFTSNIKLYPTAHVVTVPCPPESPRFSSLLCPHTVLILHPNSNLIHTLESRIFSTGKGWMSFQPWMLCTPVRSPVSIYSSQDV